MLSCVSEAGLRAKPASWEAADGTENLRDSGPFRRCGRVFGALSPRTQPHRDTVDVLPAIVEFLATSDIHYIAFHPQGTCLPARDGRLIPRFRFADDTDTHRRLTRSHLNVNDSARKYSGFQIGIPLLLRDDAEGGITSEAPTPRDQVIRRRLESGRRELRIAASVASAIFQRNQQSDPATMCLTARN